MSFPRYPKYKPSGVEWLGEVPEHWILKPIWTHFRRIKRVGYGDEQLLSVYRDYGVIPKSSRDDNFNNASDDLSAYQLVIPGDLAINKMKAWQGSVAISEHRGIVSPAYFVFEALHSANGRYLHYPMRSLRYVTGYLSVSKGIRINQWDLEPQLHSRMPLIIPPITEQLAIATFLDRETSKIDALVTEQRRLIELLKEKRQSVISHAVTKGLNPNAPMKPSGIEWLGDVPTAWTLTKLGRAAFMQEGPGLRNWQFTNEGTRVICVTNITENGIDFSRLEKFISNDEYNSSYRHFTVQTGDVLLSSSGNSWGKVAIYAGDDKVILNTSTIRLNESEGSPLIRDFLAMLLQSDTVREQLGLAMTGSCQPNFGPTHLNSVMVAVPSRQEQSDIVSFLVRKTSALDVLAAEAERAIELLQERRTALISAAVTGKFDVREEINAETIS